MKQNVNTKLMQLLLLLLLKVNVDFVRSVNRWTMCVLIIYRTFLDLVPI